MRRTWAMVAACGVVAAGTSAVAGCGASGSVLAPTTTAPPTVTVSAGDGPVSFVDPDELDARMSWAPDGAAAPPALDAVIAQMFGGPDAGGATVTEVNVSSSLRLVVVRVHGPAMGAQTLARRLRDAHGEAVRRQGYRLVFTKADQVSSAV